MSRTTRKRYSSFEDDMSYILQFVSDKKEFGRLKAQWMNSKYNGFSMSHEFRNLINRRRRRNDKIQILKSIRYPEYEELCSNWNCKDNNAWVYF